MTSNNSKETETGVRIQKVAYHLIKPFDVREILSVVRHMAMNLVQQATPTTSLKNRRKLAGWDPSYLETLIRQTA